MSNYELIIPIHLSYEKYLLYYEGQINQVIATSEDGKKIAFPANVLKKFITHQGIQGNFKFVFNQSGKILSVNKISP